MAKKIAFCITGGGARISQQAAMCDFLINEKGKVPEVLSGTSAGGLLTVAVDSILAGRWGWDGLKNTLWNLKNDEIYRNIPVLKKAALILCKRFAAWYETSPERELFRKMLKEIKINKLKELKRICYICGVRNQDGHDIRWYNRDPAHGELKIEDVLMGTSAIPFKFPPQEVPYNSGPYYVDGGAGRDFSPLEVLFKHELDEIYVLIPGRSKNPPKINSQWIVDNVYAAVDHMLNDIFDLQVDYYPRLDPQTDYYVIQPVFEYPFDPMDFEKGFEQYEATWRWLEKNFDKIKPQPSDWPPKRHKAKPGIDTILKLIARRERKRKKRKR